MWASVVVLVAMGVVLTGCLTETGGPSSPAPRLTMPLTTEGGQTTFSTDDTVYVTFGGPAGTYYYYLEYESTPNSFSTSTQRDDLYCWYRNLAAGEHTLTVYLETGGQRSPLYTFEFTVGGDGDGYEWDGSSSSATTITINGGAQLHTIAAADTDWYSFSATAGQVCTLQTLGSMDTKMCLYQTNATTLITSADDYNSNSNAHINWTCSTSGTYYFYVVGYSATTTGSYTVSVTTAGSAGDSYEPDNTLADANAITVDDAAQSHTLTVNDSDWVWFSAYAGYTYMIATTGSIDVDLDLWDDYDNLVDYDDGAGNALLTFNCTTSGWYYIRTYGFSGAIGSYTLSVTSP